VWERKEKGGTGEDAYFRKGRGLVVVVATFSGLIDNRGGDAAAPSLVVETPETKSGGMEGRGELGA
jgi:hypothetical protein